MNRVVVILGVSVFALAIGLAEQPSANACGFKAGGAIGAVRYDQLNRTSNPVNIVMYSNPSSADAEKVLSPKLEIVLSKVGHAVKRVTTKEELNQVLSRGKWDCETHGFHDVQVVLADLPDAEAIGTSKYAVVPIVSKPAEFDREKRTRYPVVLTDSARPSSHVPMIETVAKNVIKKSPTLLASNVSHTQPEERTLTGSREERTAVAASDDRQPIATGGTDENQRGGPVGAGTGQRETVNAQTTRELPAQAAPEKKPEPVKTEPVKTEPVKTEPVKTEPVKAEPVVVAKNEEREPSPDQVANARGSHDREERTIEKVAERVEKTERAEKPKKVTPQPNREEMYFDLGRSSVSSKFGRALMKHVAYLKENTNKSVTIEGHADRSGPADANQALSERRADSVRAFLVAKGISGDRVRTVGYGEEKPVDPPGDSARNRCAVVTYEE